MIEIIKPQVYCIAEIGTSHQGDWTFAKELIHAASESGAKAAKFQIVFASEILPEQAGEIQVGNQKVEIFNTLKKCECDSDFFSKVAQECQKVGIDFLATPFGLKSAALLKELQPKQVKIASPEINHFPLLDEVATWPLERYILSSGVSYLSDIENGLNYLSSKLIDLQGKNLKNVKDSITLLHCVTSYPAPCEEYNLRILPLLKNLLGVNVGVSDHSLDPLLVPVLATLMGATTIEKHFTLDKNGTGVDDPIALPPEDFSYLVRSVQETALWLSNNPQAPALEYAYQYLEEYEKQQIDKTLGDGIKSLDEKEKELYLTTNRSIHALKTITVGEPFTPENLGLLRSEKGTRVGLRPELLDSLWGSLCQKELPKGEGIEWGNLLQYS